MAAARARHCLIGASGVREFAEFMYQTQHSWSRARCVIGKAEVLAVGENPRLVVSNLPACGFKDDEHRGRFEPRRLYGNFTVRVGRWRMFSSSRCRTCGRTG